MSQVHSKKLARRGSKAPGGRGQEDFYSLADPGDHDSVGARIKLMREHRGLTQKAFALKLGNVGRGAVALWETNRGGESKHLPRVAEVLGVPMEFFINGFAESDTNIAISIDEHALVDMYRGCEISGRLTLLRTASRLRRVAVSKKADAENTLEIGGRGAARSTQSE